MLARRKLREFQAKLKVRFFFSIKYLLVYSSRHLKESFNTILCQLCVVIPVAIARSDETTKLVMCVTFSLIFQTQILPRLDEERLYHHGVGHCCHCNSDTVAIFRAKVLKLKQNWQFFNPIIPGAEVT